MPTQAVLEGLPWIVGRPPGQVLKVKRAYSRFENRTQAHIIPCWSRGNDWTPLGVDRLDGTRRPLRKRTCMETGNYMCERA